ncbi:polycystin-1-like protein 2 [Ptychodera flava]|uniref:polycystin-1-like protein 2 n=1 Tax=Ptychodera flava TaxID=63121 RepID=UPI00396A49D1
MRTENLSAEIEIFIPQDPLVSTIRIIEIDNLNTSRLQTKFTIDKPGKSVLLSVETNEIDLTFQLYVQYKVKPSSEEFDDTIILPGEDGGCYTTLDSETNPCFWFLSSEYLHRLGTYHVLVRVDGAFQSEGVSVSITMYSADCVYWDGDAGEWLTDGCRVGRLTTPSYTHCLCDHLTVFGGSMSVFENPVSIFEIQPSFTTILDNPVLLSAIVGLFAIYLMLAIWAVRQDRIDRARAKICVLEDNYPSAAYYYDVTVHTGYRPRAGTSADVALTLCGVKGESEPHVLRSLARKVLQRGDTETFRLTTNQSLGKIEAVRLWHDNSGDHPSWFVGHIIVHELETNRSWYFSCNAWLATDTRSGHIDRVFKANKVDDLKKFKRLFVFKATKDIRDRHLWFGIFGRPTRSKFTRLQRISCVLSLILGTMMANVMLCGVLEEEYFRGMDAGKFHFSWRNPVIGMAGSVIVFPINLAIVQLFRCIESKAQEAKEGYSESDSLQYDSASSERTAVSSLSRRISLSASSGEISAESSVELSPQGSTQESSTEWMDLNSEISFFRGSDTAITSATDTSSVVVADEYIFLSLNQVRDDCKDDLLATDDVSVVDQYTNLDLNLDILLKLTGMEERPEASALVEVDDTVILTGGKRPFQILLPSNFVYVGWLVVAATVFISAYYVLLYGLKHGKEQSAYWLVTVCVSMFQSVFLEQPALVFFSAIFFAVFIKDVVDDDVPDGDVDGVDSPLPAVYFDSLDMATEHVSRLRQGAIYSPPKPLEESGAALTITVEGGRSFPGEDLENDEAAKG